MLRPGMNVRCYEKSPCCPGDARGAVPGSLCPVLMRLRACLPVGLSQCGVNHVV